MDRETRDMLEGWIASGPPHLRDAALARLAKEGDRRSDPSPLTPPPADPPRPSAAASLAAIRAAEACPHRSARTDCGCAGMAGCALGRGRGDGLVALNECLECPDRPPIQE